MKKPVFLLMPLVVVGCTLLVSCADMLNNSGGASLSVPSGLSASSSTSSSVKLSWNAVSGASGYIVYSGTSESSVSSSTTTSDTSCTVSYLTSNTTYYFCVSAYDSSRESNRSSTVSKTTLLAAPAGLTASSVTSTTVSLSWYSVSGATKYYVYYGTSSSSVSNYAGSTFLTSYIVGDLSSGTTYYFRVSAYNSNGESDKSAYDYATTSSSGSGSGSTPQLLTVNAPNNGNNLYTTSSLSSGDYNYYYFYASSYTTYYICWFDKYCGKSQLSKWGYSSYADAYIASGSSSSSYGAEIDGSLSSSYAHTSVTPSSSGKYYIRVRAGSLSDSKGYYAIRVCTTLP